jgi:nucleoside-diphosphate-sugar epimerase
VFDISAAKEQIGFVPAYSVEEGVRDYVATMDRLGR